jgi:hypothetical protein
MILKIFSFRFLISMMLCLAPLSLAQAEVSEKGILHISRSCPAYSSKNSRSNPGSIQLKKGEQYPVVARNQSGGDWLRVQIKGADPALRWVERTCGILDTDNPVPISGGGVFEPFFDQVPSGPKDRTPPPPRLDTFDKAVLSLCGEWGTHPRAGAFRVMLETTFPDRLAAIKKAVGGTLVPDASPQSDADFARALTDAWFQEGAFTHIYCGEPSQNSLGGLHFAGRYLQAQQQGWAGALPANKCRQTEIDPPIYTFGVAYQIPGGGIGEACPKGYGYDQSALDILIEGSIALKEARAWSNPDAKNACIYQLEGPNRPYHAVFVIKNNAIRTFYPDATPSSRDRRCE